MKAHNIFVFYHVFMTGAWKYIFTRHLKEVIDSGLYDEMKEMNIGAIFENENDLRKLKGIVKKFKKINLFYKRKRAGDMTNARFCLGLYSEKSDTCLSKECLGNMHRWGEGETLIKMVEFARKKNDNDIYLFFHSKGVTKPKDRRRGQMRFFYRKGLDKKSSDIHIREFISRDMRKEVITRWKDRAKIVSNPNNHFYYYVWNFFWTNGKLLKKFKYEEYRKWMDRKYRSPRGRHFTAEFPVNLYNLINNVKHRHFTGDVWDYSIPGHWL